MPDNRAPRVFISYSHDDEPHKARVLALADRLRSDGADVMIDRFEPVPPLRWPLWCERQIDRADVVLLVCTETYHRRVNGEEEPDAGLSVLWEAAVIYQLLYEQGPANRKFVPLLFSDGLLRHIPTPVRGFSRFVVDKPDGYDALYRFLTGQPATPAGPLGNRREMPPDRRPDLPDQAVPPPASPPSPPTQVDRVFVGRGEELATLAMLLLAPDRSRYPVVVSGMPGVGKSYLVDRLYAEHGADFPGGYIRLSLDPEALATASELLA